VIIIVAGVAGSGKTTVGAILAGRLRWRFADADTFHPRSNIEKMHSGKPLTDEERRPWLEAIARWMDERTGAGQSAIVTCSALTRAYRDQLTSGRPTAAIVFLEVSRDILLRRVSSRPDHFFPEELLQSQLDTVQMPSPSDEPKVHVIDANGGAIETADKIVTVLWPHGGEGDPSQASA
jgi:gluconokinase